MQCSTSTSESFQTALEFAAYCQAREPHKQPVLFVIAVHNYDKLLPYTAFRLDSELFSAHPGDKEVLFAEGTPMTVIGVDEIQFSKRSFDKDSQMQQFNGKSITIIYLFHTSNWYA